MFCSNYDGDEVAVRRKVMMLLMMMMMMLALLFLPKQLFHRRVRDVDMKRDFAFVVSSSST